MHEPLLSRSPSERTRLALPAAVAGPGLAQGFRLIPGDGGALEAILGITMGDGGGDGAGQASMQPIGARAGSNGSLSGDGISTSTATLLGTVMQPHRPADGGGGSGGDAQCAHGHTPGAADGFAQPAERQFDQAHCAPGASKGVQPAAPFTIQYTEKEKRERKYECEYCKKRFLRPSSLTSHVYTHTGERPFACAYPGCSRRFSVQSNLRRHHKVHTKRPHPDRDERARGVPFACSLFSGGPSAMDGTLGPSAGPSPSLFFPSNPLLTAAHMPPHLGCVVSDSARRVVASGTGFLPGTLAPASQYRSTYPWLSAAGQPGHRQHGHAMAVGDGALMGPSPLPQASIGSIIEEAISRDLNALPLLAHMTASEPVSPPRPNPVPLSLIASLGSSSSSPGSGHSLCLTDTVLGSSFGSSASVGQALPNGLGATFTSSQVGALVDSACTAYTGDSDSSSDSATAVCSRVSSIGASGGLFLAGASGPPPPPPMDTCSTAGGGHMLAGMPMIATPAILTNSSATTKAMNGGIEPQRSASGDAAALLGTLYGDCYGGGGGGCTGGTDSAVWQLLQAARPQR